MALTHNQINKLWYNPTYNNFKNHGFSKQIFTYDQAFDFLKTGAYLVKEAEKLSNILIPWREDRRYEILANPRLENAFFSLGSEYVFKGIFLYKGYSINKLRPGIRLRHPVPLARNKSKLVDNEVYGLGYIVNHLKGMFDFSDFDNSQQRREDEEKNKLKGKRLQGITRMTIPYPKAVELLDYVLFKRNYSLHRPFIIPEFKGITRQVYEFLNYVVDISVGQNLEKLSKLDEL